MIMDINQPFVTQEQKFKYWEESKSEIQTLRAKVASAEVFNLEQILHDPENQPSQYGTVPLEWYENLENKINRIRFNVEQVIDSLSGNYDMHAIRKKLQTAVDEQALATQASESEINSLKQRVEELQADNLRLREALKDFEKWIEELPIPTKGASFFYKKLGSLIAEAEMEGK